MFEYKEDPFAQVAQSVEQRTENPRVGGSIPSLGTILVSDHGRHGLKGPERSGPFVYPFPDLSVLVRYDPPLSGALFDKKATVGVSEAPKRGISYA